MNVVRRLQAFNAGRDPERLQIKYRLMRASAFAFLRGTDHLFYERLPRGGLFRTAPRVWACGDLHLENFGSYKGDNRLVYFDINDFDEAMLAPASWDLVRLLASLRVGADSLSISPREASALCKDFLQAYVSSLAEGKAYWVERDTAHGLVRELLDGLRHRPRARLLAARTTVQRGRRVLRVDGKKALPATAAQRAAIGEFMAAFAARQSDPAFYEVIDIARRIAGTGSLGVDRFAILVQGKGSPDGHYLLDLKQALPSSLAPYLKVPQPAWESEAHRVVALQRRVQAVSMAFLQPVLFGGGSCVLRALQPSEDRMTLDRSQRSMTELAQALQVMGRVVAWGQLRSAGRDGSATADELIAFAQRRKWQAELLALSQDCAEQVRKDWATYSSAFDDRVFKG
ncbi:hypothetical protein SRS16CHR_01487 [Variovorax sp. SRS16]|uniref:DUF2252 domain-containing protein n=1 Tax=Variovorax sp. SRS16 TaxID=282217 RepID=UPI0013188174|nr:DUF2252 family protein [Variovorax sp. SRS16]VTU15454.1 hypothetical protein SRS16CHR_01487 [Variovorax sp. SRS16]